MIFLVYCAPRRAALLSRGKTSKTNRDRQQKDEERRNLIIRESLYLFAVEVGGRNNQMSNRRQVSEAENQDLRRRTDGCDQPAAAQTGLDDVSLEDKYLVRRQKLGSHGQIHRMHAGKSKEHE